jgi:TolC family type I secretion outer membrane protein
LVVLSIAPASARAHAAQATSPDPSVVWAPSPKLRLNATDRAASPQTQALAAKPYTLAELADLAERHNPETRVAWERARVRAAQVGIARSALLPTLAGLVLGQTLRQGVLFGTSFVRQTEGIGTVALELDYTVFDYGARQQALSAAHDELFAANFAFNNTHLTVLYQVTDAYYRLLSAIGQVAASEANLENARTVRENADARLAQGLATLPDALEARAAAAQAEYDLASLVGARQIALGDLLTVIGLPVTTPLTVEPLDQLAPPAVDEESAEEAIDRALAQRPDLLAQVARIRAADARIREAHSPYFPRLTFSGNLGRLRAYGEQDLLLGTYGNSGEWNAQLNLNWTLFDGGRRASELAQVHAERRQAESELDAQRDQAENQVWTAYANMKTALAQQRAAQALLEASTTSYNAAVESYGLGVRNLLDVVQAQRTLAQARSQDVTARANVFRQTAGLAFRTGDLLRQPVPHAAVPPASQLQTPSQAQPQPTGPPQ